MASPTRPRSLRVAVLVITTVFLGAACGPLASTGASPSGPTGSGAAACATAPNPPEDLEGWGPPAQAPQIVPVLIASPGQLVCGPNRVLFTLLDATDRPIGAPDRIAKLAIFNLGRDPNQAVVTTDAAFIWAIEDERGIYVANVTFPDAGRYGAEITTTAAGGAPEVIRLTFDVQPSSSIVKVGDRAPASKTPTLADVGGDATKVSTDATPDPAFYDTSVDQAIANHEPFVLIFATPKFCTSAQCGPTLDRIKPYAARYPGVTFINVEPYRLKLVNGTLQPDLNADGQLQTAAVTEEWHLFNEPTVYVVDRDGIVRAAFELMFSDAELTTALDAVK